MKVELRKFIFIDIERIFAKAIEQKAIGFVPCSASCHVKRNEIEILWNIVRKQKLIGY